MNSRERVFTVIDHKIPDRVPVTNSFTPEVASDLKKIIGMEIRDTVDLEVELGHDLLSTKEIGIVDVYSIEDNKKINEENYVDDFGIIKKLVNYEGGTYVEVVKNPLEDLDKFSSYKFPDPENQSIMKKHFKRFEEVIKKYGKTHAIVGGVTCTIFEGAETLRGMERLMVDLVENQGFVNELMDNLVDYHFRVGKKLIEIGVDIIYIGDDVGSQRGMLISPQQWRKLLKPRYDYLFREWKKINKNIKFAFHSDGYIEPIISDLVEVGLDILNPIQPGVMDDLRIKKEFGKKLCFWGGINIQKTMPFGSVKDVVDEVKDRVSVYGKDGGFIIGSSNSIQPNLRSIDNTIIFYWACKKFGKYT